MEEEMTLDLRDLYAVIKKKMKLIAVVTLACTLISGISSFFLIRPTYEASATMIVGKPQDSSKNTSIQYNDVMMYQNLVKTYSQIAQSRDVAQKTIDKLNNGLTIEKLQKMVTVTSQQGTQILEIKAQSKNADDAKNIVDTLTESFISESKQVFPTGGDIQVMDKAQVPEKPVKPRKALNMIIAFLIGLMASAGFVIVVEFMDDTIKTENDVEKYLGLPVVGIIPKQSMELKR